MIQPALHRGLRFRHGLPGAAAGPSWFGQGACAGLSEALRTAAIRTYASMHVCTYARMHVCTYARMHVCTYAHMHICARRHIGIQAQRHKGTQACRHILCIMHICRVHVRHLLVCTYACKCARMHARPYVCTHFTHFCTSVHFM